MIDFFKRFFCGNAGADSVDEDSGTQNDSCDTSRIPLTMEEYWDRELKEGAIRAESRRVEEKKIRKKIRFDNVMAKLKIKRSDRGKR